MAQIMNVIRTSLYLQEHLSCRKKKFCPFCPSDPDRWDDCQTPILYW